MATNLPVKDADGNVVTIQSPVRGTAGSPSVDVASIQGVVGGVALPIAPAVSSPTDRSSTITSGGVSQLLCAANANRRGLVIQNQSTGDLWFNRKGVAAVIGQPSIRIPANSYWEAPSGGAGVAAVYIIGASTGQAFAADEW